MSIEKTYRVPIWQCLPETIDFLISQRDNENMQEMQETIDEFGIRYTELFKFQYELFQYWVNHKDDLLCKE